MIWLVKISEIKFLMLDNGNLKALVNSQKRTQKDRTSLPSPDWPFKYDPKWIGPPAKFPESLWFGKYGKPVRGSIRRLLPPHSGASIPSRIPGG